MRRNKANGSSFSDVVGTPSPTTHLTLFFIMEINTMETKYKLLIYGLMVFGVVRFSPNGIAGAVQKTAFLDSTSLVASKCFL